MIHGKSINENLIGPCGACGDEMREYEVERCPACDKLVHKDCLSVCKDGQCLADGCKACHDKGFCDEECKQDYNQAILRELARKAAHTGSREDLKEYLEARRDLL